MSSGTLNAATSDTGGGRAFRPGPRWAFGAAVVAAVVAAIIVVMMTSGGGHPAPASAAKATAYGKLPSWLPKYKVAPTKFELATPAKPILSEEQGFTVHAVMPSGAADITAVGPAIPAYVSRYVQDGVWQSSHAAPGTFIVSVTNVKGSIPLSAGAFSILTNSGQIVHTNVSVKGGGALPAAIHAGQSINLKVTGGVYEGSGSIRWAPNGAKVLVGWIYQLELD
ncbi:MAG TPA: hypothetical protein VHV75_10080 [Solirubrobacteraceae bacterium]|jgi:hypothetical protein|nr:hypothetical protein [Solirubrobacteraceae bacterium]